MADLRGRPYGFIVLTLAFWIGARLSWSDTGRTDSDAASPTKPPKQIILSPPLHSRSLPIHALPAQLRAHDIASIAPAAPAPPLPLRKMPLQKHGLRPALVPWQVGSRPSGLSLPLRVAGEDEPMSPGRDTPPTIAHALAGKAGPPIMLRQKRWQIYAYSFWRASQSASPILGPNAQYGGSQSGVTAALDPFGAPDRGVMLLMRGSVMPVSGGATAHELSLGLRWKPKRNWPVTLTAERRFRDRSNDDFAVYLAGGVQSISLVKNWKLDAFGQAGYATERRGGGFFDAQARAMRPLSAIGNNPVEAGIGSWAGGQEGAHRLDVGPTVAAKFEAGPAVVLVQLDWRVRVAGNAEPKNGLALTVSTGF